MFGFLGHIFSLGRAGIVLARSGLVTPDLRGGLPAPARFALTLARIGVFGHSEGARVTVLSKTFQSLGPSHIKLGQFLATRPDVIGEPAAAQLTELQDRLPAFTQAEALETIEHELGRPVAELFDEFTEAVAAASIAQVHKARTRGEAHGARDVAVKILRPGIEQKLARDLDGFQFAAGVIEGFSRTARRLRPKAAVETLARSVAIELDLRLEAAAISEMAANTTEDAGFTIPEVDWARTSRRVLTLDWVDGTPISDTKALAAAGHNLPRLAETLIQSFLRHAMRDGFFHADMHQGNLFVDDAGDLVAVDFGIMGRLDEKDRRFLAEILFGFITRDYRRVADVHFDAGYVPVEQSPELFAQALRAIGEPIMGKLADDISMARLLAQLFRVTEQFDMQTQPQLLLLQKTMVVVEGVARLLDRELNMWTIAEPVVRDWMAARLGPEGRIQEAAEGAAALARLLSDLPETVTRFERMAATLEHQPLSERSRSGGSGMGFSNRAPAWIAAGALALIALAMLI